MRSFGRGTDDPVSRFAERTDAQVGRVVWRSLRISVINENSLTSSIITCFDVAPAVADHETVGQIDIVLAGGFEQHSGLRLAAGAVVGVGVGAGVSLATGVSEVLASLYVWTVSSLSQPQIALMPRGSAIKPKVIVDRRRFTAFSDIQLNECECVNRSWIQFSRIEVAIQHVKFLTSGSCAYCIRQYLLDIANPGAQHNHRFEKDIFQGALPDVFGLSV